MLIPPVVRWLICFGIALTPGGLYGQVTPPPPKYWSCAPVPPMGWNSYQAFGDSVTEQEVVRNAGYIKEHLLAHGWKYVVVDFRWYDAVATLDDRDLNKNRAGARLTADLSGRLIPAPNRFPSANGGRGFKGLADRLHDMGLRLGIHVMRGIPRQAVNDRTPIDGSPFTAADAGDPGSKCEWCPDMFGVRANAAGQAWYDSCARLWASWGVDFVKVDDLSSPYHAEEIEMLRKALDGCGRPIVMSTSPGPTPVDRADHIKTHANLWRISNDFWDRWTDLDHQFDLLAQWQGVAGPGHWPDADMIPFGHIGIRSHIAGPDRRSRFTHDEQLTLISLWSLAASPLMLGGNLPDTDPWTLAVLTNDEVLAVNQDPLGSAAKRVTRKDGTEVWTKALQKGSTAIGFFNRSAAAVEVALARTDAGLTGQQNLRDLWNHRDMGRFEEKFSVLVPAHGAVFLRATPAR